MTQWPPPRYASGSMGGIYWTSEDIVEGKQMR